MANSAAPTERVTSPSHHEHIAVDIDAEADVDAPGARPVAGVEVVTDPPMSEMIVIPPPPSRAPNLSIDVAASPKDGPQCTSPRPPTPRSPCCVCLESLDAANTAWITGCRHKIHMNCLSAMCTFQSSRVNANGTAPGGGLRCPLCRTVFDSFQLQDGSIVEVDIPGNDAEEAGTTVGDGGGFHHGMGGRVAAPVFNPNTPTVPWGTELTLSCPTPGAVIYYCTDLSDMLMVRQFRLQRYREPVMLRGSRVCVRALAVKDGMMHSPLSTLFCETTVCGVRLSKFGVLLPAFITVAVAVLFVIVVMRVG
eukprot:PhM_4_TR4485/c0_g2_i1/m.73472